MAVTERPRRAPVASLFFSWVWCVWSGEVTTSETDAFLGPNRRDPSQNIHESTAGLISSRAKHSPHNPAHR